MRGWYGIGKLKGGLRRSGDSSLASRDVFLRVVWRGGAVGGERVRNLRFVGVEAVEGFRWSGDRVLFLCSEGWNVFTGFRRRGEIVRARSSSVRSIGVGVELVSFEARMEEILASIISEVRSMERPLACRSSSSFSFDPVSRTGEPGGANDSFSARKELIFRIWGFIRRGEISLSSFGEGIDGDACAVLSVFSTLGGTGAASSGSISVSAL